MIILQLSDFTGDKYNIPNAASQVNTTRAKVQEFIDKYEKPYIYKLLGVTLGDLFIAWLAASQTPPNADYLKILNSFAADNDGNCGFGNSIVQSLGMKEYLTAAVFYEFIKNGLITTPTGVVNSSVETANAQNPTSTMRFADNKFNDILGTAEAIQWYCRNNSTAFPDFKGQRIAVKFELG